MRLGEETRIILYNYGYEISDIDWIGCEEFQIGVADFFRHADNFEYDSGYGHAYVALDLKIVMNDGTWFERHEYDGSEYWVHKGAPRNRQSSKNLKALIVVAIGRHSQNLLRNNET